MVDCIHCRIEKQGDQYKLVWTKNPMHIPKSIEYSYVITENAASIQLQADDLLNKLNQYSNTPTPGKLKDLATEGYMVYRMLIPQNDDQKQTKIVDCMLNKLGIGTKLKITEGVTDGIQLPWNCIYEEDPQNSTEVLPDHFWGFKYSLSVLPESMGEISNQEQLPIPPSKILCGIDKQFYDKWKNIGQVLQKLHCGCTSCKIPDCGNTIPGGNQLVAAINATPPNILFLFCHASKSETNAWPRLSLNCLEVDTKQLKRLLVWEKYKDVKPLVFFMGCFSGQTNNITSIGFKEIFCGRGWRGMIAVDAKVRPEFAERFVKDFFSEFIKCEKQVGEIIYDLRWQYYNDSKERLKKPWQGYEGLLFSLYCPLELKAGLV